MTKHIIAQQIKQIDSLFSDKKNNEIQLIESSRDLRCDIHGRRRGSCASLHSKRDSLGSIHGLNNTTTTTPTKRDSVTFSNNTDDYYGINRRESINRNSVDRERSVTPMRSTTPLRSSTPQRGTTPLRGSTPVRRDSGYSASGSLGRNNNGVQLRRDSTPALNATVTRRYVCFFRWKDQVLFYWN